MIRIRIQRDFSRLGYAVWFLQDCERGEGRHALMIAKPMEFEYVEHPEHITLPDPTFTLREDELAAFSKELGEKGFIIQADTGSARHLSDMRKIVSKQLGIEL